MERFKFKIKRFKEKTFISTQRRAFVTEHGTFKLKMKLFQNEDFFFLIEIFFN